MRNAPSILNRNIGSRHLQCRLYVAKLESPPLRADPRLLLLALPCFPALYKLMPERICSAAKRTEGQVAHVDPICSRTSSSAAFRVDRGASLAQRGDTGPTHQPTLSSGINNLFARWEVFFSSLLTSSSASGFLAAFFLSCLTGAKDGNPRAELAGAAAAPPREM